MRHCSGEAGDSGDRSFKYRSSCTSFDLGRPKQMEKMGVRLLTLRVTRAWKRFKPYVISVAVICLIVFLQQYGLYEYFFAESFSNFKYDLEVDMPALVSELRNGNTVKHTVINPHTYPFIHGQEKEHYCHDSDGQPANIYLLVVVKSAVSYYANRMAVRETYGQDIRKNKSYRLVFLLGRGTDREQTMVYDEHKQFHDIVQEDFVDHYFNNTIKALAGFRWVSTFCPHASYVLFVDDDYYVKLPNLFALLSQTDEASKQKSQRIFRGYVYARARPKRTRWSVWYTPVEEYPYISYPPYITAGAYLLDQVTVRDFWLSSAYVKYSRFDDVYMGILAWKLKIAPIHDERFVCDEYGYSVKGYRHIIAMHGLRNPEKLRDVYRLDTRS